jgi:addiction module HigA family antidote
MKSLRSHDRKPTHPGEILREIVFPELKMSQAEIAMRLGVSRRTISEIIHERRPVTADMAIRLAHFLGGTPNSWLNMQLTYDIWHLERANKDKYDDIEQVG